MCLVCGSARMDALSTPPRKREWGGVCSVEEVLSREFGRSYGRVEEKLLFSSIDERSMSPSCGWPAVQFTHSIAGSKGRYSMRGKVLDMDYTDEQQKLLFIVQMNHALAVPIRMYEGEPPDFAWHVDPNCESVRARIAVVVAATQLVPAGVADLAVEYAAFDLPVDDICFSLTFSATATVIGYFAGTIWHSPHLKKTD